MVTVSSEEWRDSVIHIHASILPQTQLPVLLCQLRKLTYGVGDILEVSQLVNVRLCILLSSSPSPSTQTAASDLQKFYYVSGITLRTLHILSYLVFARTCERGGAVNGIFLMRKPRPRAFESLS